MEKTQKNTKMRLIKAACKVFSEKGYYEATIADICALSGTNIAAVNYHFGDKDRLYAHAWRYAFDESLKAYPPEGSLGEEACAQDKLKARIYSLLNRVLDDGEVGYFSRMLFAELAAPTNSIDDVIKEAVKPQREKIHNIISQLLGDAATNENVCLCGMCIMNMCTMFAISSRLRKKVFTDGCCSEINKTMLKEHIYNFAMGGIENCRKQYFEERS